MGAYTTNYSLYKFGGGSDGKYGPDEIMDVSKLNTSLDTIDTELFKKKAGRSFDTTTLMNAASGDFYGQRASVVGSTIEYRWNGTKWCPFFSSWMNASSWVYNGLNAGTGASGGARYRWDAGMVLFQSWLNLGSGPSGTYYDQVLPEPVSFKYNTPMAPFLDSKVIVRDPASGNRIYFGRTVAVAEDSTSVSTQLDIADTTYLYAAKFNNGAPIALVQSEQIWTEIRYESTNYMI